MGTFCANIEPLEERRLLAAIAGTVYGDLNAGVAGIEVGLNEASRPAAVKGIVFGDINGDGLMNGDDEPINAAFVVITSKGVPIQSVATGPDGAYQFVVDASTAHLEIGVYGIGAKRFRDPTVALALTPSQTKTIDLPSRTIFLPSWWEMSGVVFEDANGNAFRDDGERVFPGVAVYYDRNLNGQFDQGEAKFTTDAQGRYSRMLIDAEDVDAFGLSFDPPTTGWTWRVLSSSGPNREKNIAVTPPEGWTEQPQVCTCDPVAIPLPIEPIPLPIEPIPLPIDPPIIHSGTISGWVFNDFNRNGIMDPGEKPVVGADVGLKGPLARENPFLRAIFDLHRKLMFDSLPSGTYQLRPTFRSNIEQTFTVDLEEGEDITVNLPLRVPTLVSGTVARKRKGHNVPLLRRVTVYLDRNDNGRRDADEEAIRIGGKIRDTCELRVRTPTDGLSICAVRTDYAYEFDHVRAGAFTVRLEGIGPHLQVTGELPKGVAERGETIVLKPIILRQKPPTDSTGLYLWTRRPGHS